MIAFIPHKSEENERLTSFVEQVVSLCHLDHFRDTVISLEQEALSPLGRR